MNHPFRQKRVQGKLVREFSKDVDSEELVWHRDREDRVVKICRGSGWKLQVENKLPVSLVPGKNYFIPKYTYHRVLRGNSDLVVEIYEPSSSSSESENLLLREYISLCRGK